MRNDAETIDFALSLFGKDPDEGVYLTGCAQEIGLRLAQAKKGHPPNAGSLARLFQHITFDLGNISLLVDRLEWMRTRALTDNDLEQRWFPYATLDIQAVHIEIRSVLDYVAHIIRLFAPQPGQVTDTGSFQKLLEWLKTNAHRIQPEVATLTLEQSKWFAEVRRVRDQLVHRGALTIIFGTPRDGILFQIMDDSFTDLVRRQYLMYNVNVVYFDRYAALYLARVLAFLEDLSILYRDAIVSRFDAHGVRSSAAGHATLVAWMQNLRGIIGEGEAAV